MGTGAATLERETSEDIKSKHGSQDETMGQDAPQGSGSDGYERTEDQDDDRTKASSGWSDKTADEMKPGQMHRGTSSTPFEDTGSEEETGDPDLAKDLTPDV